MKKVKAFGVMILSVATLCALVIITGAVVRFIWVLLNVGWRLW